MKPQEGRPSREQEHLKELSHAWEKRMENKIEEVVRAEDTDAKKILDTLWEYGVLERISPSRKDERDARIHRKKTVWPGSRDDPELYWRLLYAAEAAEESVRGNYSVISLGSGLLTGGIQGFWNAVYTERGGKLLKEALGPKAEDIFFNFLDDFKSRARLRLQDLGESPHEQLIPGRAEGIWRGIPVVIDKVGDNGLIHLRGKTYADNMRLFEKTKGKGISPSELDPSKFNIGKP